MRSIGWFLIVFLLGAAGWAGWHYHETGRWPFEPKGEFSVSEKTFDRILAQLTARQSIPPKFGPPEQLEAKSEAAKACGLQRQPVTWSRSVLDKLASTATTPAYALETRDSALLTSEGADGVVFATADTFAVNVDGSPRAYHPGDVFGRCDTATTGPDKGKRVCAINFLCYAGVRIFQGAREVSCGAHEAYKRAWDEVWGEIVAGRAKAIPRSFWNRAGSGRFTTHYGFFHPTSPTTVMFRSNIIPQAETGRPCQRDVPGSKYEGYFVSSTSLKGDEGEAEREGRDASKIVTDARCNPIPYVDAESLASVVIPVGGFAGAKVGDLVVAYRKDAAGVERWVYAIVGDEGPNHKFGEGSVAFNAALVGSKPGWESYRQIVRDLHIAPGKQSMASPVGVLIFKGTADRLGSLYESRNVHLTARALFEAWGGTDIDKAKARLRACMSAIE